MDGFPAETELIHGAGVEILDEDIALLYEFGENLFSVRGLCVESE